MAGHLVSRGALGADGAPGDRLTFRLVTVISVLSTNSYKPQENGPSTGYLSWGASECHTRKAASCPLLLYSTGQNACWVKKVPKVYMAVASTEGTGVSLSSLFYELFRTVTECLLKYCILSSLLHLARSDIYNEVPNCSH